MEHRCHSYLKAARVFVERRFHRINYCECATPLENAVSIIDQSAFIRQTLITGTNR